MPFRKHVESIFTLFLLCLAFLIPSAAQTELAHVNGRVTDQSNAVVVDTEVEIKNVDTNLSLTVKTNQDGLYAFPSLRPGRYQLSARKPGFKTVTVTQFTLNAQDHVSRDFVLQVGSRPGERDGDRKTRKHQHDGRNREHRRGPPIRG